MATSENEFHLRVRRRVQEKILKDVTAGTSNNDTSGLLGPMGYKGPPVSAYSFSNFLWLLAAGGVFYYTDFMNTLIDNPHTRKPWLHLGLLLISVNVCICLFLVVWLTYIRKVKTDDWEKLYPAAIPVATGAFILGAIFLTIGLWPVWRFFTPLILFTLLMGMVVVIAMLPSWL